ncbi:MAG: hypothetical protein WCS94_08215 [Verrucomicrobiota bacterium]
MSAKKTKLITLKELQDDRAKMEKAAREAAQAAALAHYFPGAYGVYPDKDLLRSLKHLVYQNWLKSHAFEHQFQPLYALN